MRKQPEVTARTRQKFIDAFWNLAEEKNVKQITVGEIARLAGYNRSTFYEYFTDTSDLLQQIEEELLQYLQQELAELSQDADPDSLGNSFRLLFHSLNQRAYCLMGPNGDPSFSQRMISEFLPWFARYLGISSSQPSLRLDYIIAYASSAIVGFMQYWHEQGQTMPEEEVFALGCELVSHGILGVLNESD